MGAAQTLIWSYSWVFLPPISRVFRTSGCIFVFVFFLRALNVFLNIFHRHRVCLVDHVDLIHSLYSWWEGFWVFFLSHTVPRFQLWLYLHLCMWVVHRSLLLRCPEGLGFASLSARCGHGAASWVTGALAAPGTQGSWWLGQQEICCSIRVATHSTTLAWRTPRQRSLAGLSSQGHKDLVTTEPTHIHRCRTFSSLWQFCPSEDWVWRWRSCLTVPSVQGHRLPQLQLWLYQSLFLASAASNQKASLASPSLLLRPFMQLEVSLAWAPSLLLGASGTWRAPLAGVLLYCSMPQALERPASLLFTCWCWS